MKADVTSDNPKAYALLDELGNVAHSIPCRVHGRQPGPTADTPRLFSKDDLLAILAEPPDLIEVDVTVIGE